MFVGYARVSTMEQNISLQLDALAEAGCEKIFEDKISGTKKVRPGLQAALKFAKSGDTLVVWRLDRLGRSLKHLIEMVSRLEERGIDLRSLHEALDTKTAGGRLIFQIFGALAEFEPNLIRARTLAGLNAACARGRKGGRPKALDSTKAALLYKLRDEKEHTVKEICHILEISKPTFDTYLKQRNGT
jgi:DNA invertase Pin-like site-specific DNA recombinase